MSSPRSLLLLALAVCVCLVSCSSTEKAERVKPGTPAYYWQQAQAAWEKNDFISTASNLDKLTARDSEYRQRAQVWLMAIHAGLAKGDMDWADSLETGRKLSRTGEAVYRREIAAARSAASQSVMSYLELANQHLTAGVPEEPVVPFTAAPPAPRPVEIKKLEKGAMPAQAEVELIRDRLRAQAISDSTKALLPEGGKMDRNQYLAALASEMISLCDLYSAKRLNESGRVRMITQVAGHAVENMTPCDKSKELRKKIDALQKNPTKPIS
jgi:hypothetical protein